VDNHHQTIQIILLHDNIRRERTCVYKAEG